MKEPIGYMTVLVSSRGRIMNVGDPVSRRDAERELDELRRGLWLTRLEGAHNAILVALVPVDGEPNDPSVETPAESAAVVDSNLLVEVSAGLESGGSQQ